jgi:hypothetical protein
LAHSPRYDRGSQRFQRRAFTRLAWSGNQV